MFSTLWFMNRKSFSSPSKQKPKGPRPTRKTHSKKNRDAKRLVEKKLKEKENKKIQERKQRFDQFIREDCFSDFFLKEVVSKIRNDNFKVLQGEVLFSPRYTYAQITRFLKPMMMSKKVGKYKYRSRY